MNTGSTPTTLSSSATSPCSGCSNYNKRFDNFIHTYRSNLSRKAPEMTIVKAVRAQSYRDWKLHIIVDTGDTAYRQRIEEIACGEQLSCWKMGTAISGPPAPDS